MKKHNPHTPIMIREAAGTEPRVFARYGTGARAIDSAIDDVSRSKEEPMANLTILFIELGKETQEALSGLSPR